MDETSKESFFNKSTFNKKLKVILLLCVITIGIYVVLKREFVINKFFRYFSLADNEKHSSPESYKPKENNKLHLTSDLYKPEFIEEQKHYQIGHVIPWGGDVIYGVYDIFKTGNSWYYESYFEKNNEVITKKYAEAKFPIIINNKLAFIARNNNKEFVVFDGEEGKEYDRVDDLTSIGDKPLYSATKKESEGNLRVSVMVGDQEIKNYKDVEIDRLQVINNKIFYQVQGLDEKGLHTFNVYDGSVVEESSNAIAAIGSKEKAIYPVMKWDNKYQIVFGNYRSKEYDLKTNFCVGYSSPTFIYVVAGGKLAFVGRNNGKEFVVFDSKEKFTKVFLV